jgi:hypothetical protein
MRDVVFLSALVYTQLAAWTSEYRGIRRSLHHRSETANATSMYTPDQSQSRGKIHGDDETAAHIAVFVRTDIQQTVDFDSGERVKTAFTLSDQGTAQSAPYDLPLTLILLQSRLLDRFHRAITPFFSPRSFCACNLGSKMKIVDC